MKPLKYMLIGFFVPYLLFYGCAAYGYLSFDFTKYPFALREWQIIVSLIFSGISWGAASRLQEVEIKTKEKEVAKKDKEVSLEK